MSLRSSSRPAPFHTRERHILRPPVLFQWLWLYSYIHEVLLPTSLRTAIPSCFLMSPEDCHPLCSVSWSSRSHVHLLLLLVLKQNIRNKNFPSLISSTLVATTFFLSFRAERLKELSALALCFLSFVLSLPVRRLPRSVPQQRLTRVQPAARASALTRLPSPEQLERLTIPPSYCLHEEPVKFLHSPSFSPNFSGSFFLGFSLGFLSPKP